MSDTLESDWYQAPRYYDLVFDSLTFAEARFLDAVYDEYAPRGRRRVLEPACGSGRLLAALARRDYHVTGFDLSPAMVTYSAQRLARRRSARQARVRPFVADMASFEAPGRYEMAHCLVSTFKYLLSEKAARSHLQRVADHLVAGGIYVLGFHLTDYRDDRADVETWKGRRGRVEVSCKITSAPPQRRRRREAMRSVLNVKESGRSTKTLRSSWEFRTYDAEQARSLLRSVPDFEHVATYDMGYDLDTPQDLGEDNLDQVLILRRR